MRAFSSFKLHDERSLIKFLRAPSQAVATCTGVYAGRDAVLSVSLTLDMSYSIMEIEPPGHKAVGINTFLSGKTNLSTYSIYQSYTA